MTPPGVLASTNPDLGLALAVVVVFGVGAQMIASRVRMPSVLLLLLGGIAAGPGLDLVDPDEMLGDLLFPAVSLAVGILLFEGGLGLRFRDLDRQGRGPILRLITVGVVVTWVIGALGALAFQGLGASHAVLLGSILVVSGPTVVLPLLRFARVREPVNGILRWEGIFIDPVGATLAIVVLDAVIDEQGARSSLERILTTAGAGTAAGLLAAGVLVLMVSRHWVPDNLHNPFTLAIVVAAFAGADQLRPEAGLFATTVMGVALANQRWAPVGHIREFEEDLGQLILAALFIVLGARIDPDQLVDHLPGALALAAVLIVVARPLAVYLSTVGSGLTRVERFYLMCLAPRGIVAAAVSALFALELEESGTPVEELVPVTFIVIVVTVLYSAVAARVGADRFRVARPAPRGVAFVGAPAWAVDLAEALGRLDVPVLMVANDPAELGPAWDRGLLTYDGALDSEDLDVALDGLGVSTVLAVSRVEVLNTLAIERATQTVGRANVYDLPREPETAGTDSSHTAVIARRPFQRGATQLEIEARHRAGATVQVVRAENHDPSAAADAIVLMELAEDGTPDVYTGAGERPPAPGVTRLQLVGGTTGTEPQAEADGD